MHKYVLSDIKNEKIIVLYNLYVLGVLAMVALSGMAILSGRLSSFLTLGESILIVYALFLQKKYTSGVSNFFFFNNCAIRI
ncbi:Uncharacterised protein [Escherichia coli]|uniref:Uncharacterized protein n=1 Tax=Escherichia coli TaxID=562 RepID=A0A377K460_ECOLX|nr:Uncharacterised protein [Escherichia coli]